MNILETIIAHKKQEVARRKKQKPLASLVKNLGASDRNFKLAMRGGRTGAHPRLIAEIKKASPSEGLLRQNLEKEIETIARIYDRYANAISVVTDEKFFQGKPEWIKKVKSVSRRPVLYKDFIVDEYQVYEAREYGADAALLIASILDGKKLQKFIRIARTVQMDCLVEIHTKSELAAAIEAGAEIIGINNRNLETFKVSLETTLALAPFIPKDSIVVSESGFYAKENINRVDQMADAVLIGTAFMKAKNIEKKLDLLGFSPQFPLHCPLL